MTTLSQEDKAAMMADMKSLDEDMPSVGIFWYDTEEHDFFGVYKRELTPKMIEDAADKGSLLFLCLYFREHPQGCFFYIKMPYRGRAFSYFIFLTSCLRGLGR